ncbi:High mobility group protein DSP1 [Amphibalanus amphitrite]|uniref:High mobility group protein DSP1 n=1 Tax=Amphibalanus amphitrite TaxID=1232801 RepID=A0A6A4WJF3_AMPAM|nr:high mobility group protein DSP1-like [Amphibalanus amphitrite]XP_043201649.1 high mobility group protein DSP1-like [Amphibalanus amphitrite]KAF0306965.1 High mobility group protein DSP1 [Amphibalanus amphitrite]KAF0310812.1 High mobility group protein DSP1 [Amphibalanus amphitrite]
MPRVKDDKPRGRMSSYAYFVQTCREEHRKKHPDEAIAFAAFSKKCSDRWKVMNDKEKKRFVEMADRDKARFESEMKHYVPPPGAKTKTGRRKKDPNAPKRSLSAFFWFCNDERQGIREANPGFTVGDIAKELGRRWGEVDEAAKKKYVAMAEKDKERYSREMEAYKNGVALAAPANEFDDDDDEDEDDE